MILETQRGNRRDVVVAAKAKGWLNPPTGYIGNMICPMNLVGEKTGTIYYTTLTADAAAQTSRAAGVAPTATYLATTALTYAAAEYEKRYGVTEDEVKAFGSIENADMFGISAAIRSCWRAYESLVGATVIDATAYADRIATTSGKVLESLQKAAQNVKRYPGQTVLVCSEDWYLDFIGQADVKAAIQATLGNASLFQLQSMIASNPKGTVQLMASVISFAAIIIGDNEHWKVDDMQDAAAVMRIPDPSKTLNRVELVSLFKEQPIYGISNFWLPDPADPALLFTAKSFYDDNAVANKYDGRAWFEVAQLNAGAKQLVTLPSPVWASTTTTTTT
ncbi:MAG: hypothetical protein KAJ19_25010 [Gammaproteobacteria bacterium]|nr:hypothetical protein [Gammaproteobacteria bacterium]